jgi:hypothetical protein
MASLDEIQALTNYMEVYNHIIRNGYYDFGAAKTPPATISAFLGDFIRNGDSIEYGIVLGYPLSAISHNALSFSALASFLKNQL